MVKAVVRGEVIRFDQAKGYGFISPSTGGDDVFLHANDLLDEKYLVRPGAVVEFVMESGERGPKASSVQVITSEAGSKSPFAHPVAAAARPLVAGMPTPAMMAPAGSGEADDELVDVLSAEDFRREVTELLLRIDPGLSGPQILSVREAFAGLGTKYGWIGG